MRRTWEEQYGTGCILMTVNYGCACSFLWNATDSFDTIRYFISLLSYISVWLYLVKNCWIHLLIQILVYHAICFIVEFNCFKFWTILWAQGCGKKLRNPFNNFNSVLMFLFYCFILHFLKNKLLGFHFGWKYMCNGVWTLFHVLEQTSLKF